MAQVQGNPEPRRWLPLLSATVIWVVALAFLFWDGLTPLAYFYLLLPWPIVLAAKGWPPPSVSTGRRGGMLGTLIGILPLAPLVVTWLPGGSALPIFAGAALDTSRSGMSYVVGSNVADAGSKFAIVDLKLRPRLGATLDHISLVSIRLLTDASAIDVDIGASLAVSDSCKGGSNRFEAVRCTLVFQVPEESTRGRLELSDSQYRGLSEVIRFDAPREQVPHVELELVEVARTHSGARSGMRRLPEGRRYLYAALRLVPHGLSAPVELTRFSLEGEDWQAGDLSDKGGLWRPCHGVRLEGITHCTAIFAIPDGADEARLIVRSVDPGLKYGGLAGMAEVRF
jgi:hypothetical protein